MKPQAYERLDKMLRDAISPIRETELTRDLWPRMQQLLEERTTLTVSWLDWSLITLSLVWFVAFPEAIPAVFYHL